ncbi:MAG: hypothetical protein QOI01_5176 [Mycobacterium sp.]|jgi:hypothetical protein|nr:hypothetical protein [Mycobacterium sp.]
MIFVGDDWAEDHHDIHVMDAGGARLASRRLPEGLAGVSGFQVYAVNPLAVARYRDCHQVSGAKSDAGDAKLLADLVRTDRHNHRQLQARLRPPRR